MKPFSSRSISGGILVVALPEPVLLGGVLALQGFEPARKRLELALIGRRRAPRFRPLLEAEARDQAGIGRFTERGAADNQLAVEPVG
jgi:hypothetical protein